jgi:hypothetical protein
MKASLNGMNMMTEQKPLISDSFGNGVPRGSGEVNELISAWLVSDFSLQDSEIFL